MVTIKADTVVARVTADVAIVNVVVDAEVATEAVVVAGEAAIVEEVATMEVTNILYIS